MARCRARRRWGVVGGGVESQSCRYPLRPSLSADPLVAAAYLGLGGALGPLGGGPLRRACSWLRRVPRRVRLRAPKGKLKAVSPLTAWLGSKIGGVGLTRVDSGIPRVQSRGAVTTPTASYDMMTSKRAILTPTSYEPSKVPWHRRTVPDRAEDTYNRKTLVRPGAACGMHPNTSGTSCLRCAGTNAERRREAGPRALPCTPDTTNSPKTARTILTEDASRPRKPGIADSWRETDQQDELLSLAPCRQALSSARSRENVKARKQGARDPAPEWRDRLHDRKKPQGIRRQSTAPNNAGRGIIANVWRRNIRLQLLTLRPTHSMS